MSAPVDTGRPSKPPSPLAIRVFDFRHGRPYDHVMFRWEPGETYPVTVPTLVSRHDGGHVRLRQFPSPQFPAQLPVITRIGDDWWIKPAANWWTRQGDQEVRLTRLTYLTFGPDGAFWYAGGACIDLWWNEIIWDDLP